ncbi:hypothetical protein LSUCC1028_03885 [Rhodobacterales bacterium LSUCC1028]|nr:hypothetical protein [Rhodobacterales bacterium LSUCC1028]
MSEYFLSLGINIEIAVPIILVALSVVQSIIGVGVLLFGTPVFLLLGMAFHDVLILLLPISVCLSLFTFFSSPKSAFLKIEYVYLCCAVVIGTILSIEFLENLVLLVIASLLAINLILSGLNIEILKTFVNNHRRTTVALLGFLHGLSNQGGVMLVLITKTKNLPKDLSRSSVASAYGLLAIMQLITLSYLDPARFVSNFELNGLFASLLGFYFGNRAFGAMKQKSYDKLISSIVVVFILLLLFKFFVE